MTTNTLTKKIQLMRSDFSNHDIIPADAVHEFIELKTVLENQIKATWKALESYMVENNIKTLDVLTMAEKKAWKVTGQLPPRFYKQVVDTSRFAFMVEHGEKLPKGVSCTTSSYLTKTNRKVEVAWWLTKTLKFGCMRTLNVN